MVHCAISWGGSIGKPVAEIVPPSPDAGQKSWIGSMKDTMDIIGDIVSPVIDEKRYRGAARLKLLLDTHVWLFPRIGSLPPLLQSWTLRWSRWTTVCFAWEPSGR